LFSSEKNPRRKIVGGTVERGCLEFHRKKWNERKRAWNAAPRDVQKFLEWEFLFLNLFGAGISDPNEDGDELMLSRRR
jgi:hypothetical protein